LEVVSGLAVVVSGCADFVESVVGAELVEVEVESLLLLVVSFGSPQLANITPANKEAAIKMRFIDQYLIE